MSETLRNGLILASIGFVLTTVAGGLLGIFLQTRLWTYQWLAQRRSKFEEEARAVFNEVSRLMDRRLFRLKQFQMWTTRGDDERISVALSDYRGTVFDWNDSINRNLAMLQIYFGTEIREQFDYGVGKSFVDAGAKVEKIYRNKLKIDEALTDDASALIERLHRDVYEYNLVLLRRLNEMALEARPGSVGGRLGNPIRSDN